MRGKRVDKKGAGKEGEGEGREGRIEGTRVRDAPARGFLVLRDPSIKPSVRCSRCTLLRAARDRRRQVARRDGF